MPVRRAFNPEPMNRPQILPHGPSRQTPQLQAPAPQPLPPRAPQPEGLAPSGQPQPAAPMSMGAQLPSSIALRPPVPPQPQQPPRVGDGTVTPFNASSFLHAQAGTASGQPQPNDQSALLKLLATLGHTGDADHASS